MLPQLQILLHGVRWSYDVRPATGEEVLESAVRILHVHREREWPGDLDEIFCKDLIHPRSRVVLGASAECAAEARVFELLDNPRRLNAVSEGSTSILDQKPIQRKVDRC